MEAVFNSYSSEGRMDRSQFLKLCDDAVLFDDNFSSTDADTIFETFKRKGATTLDQPRYQLAVEEIARVKEVKVAAVTRALDKTVVSTVRTQRRGNDLAHTTWWMKEDFHGYLATQRLAPPSPSKAESVVSASTVVDSIDHVFEAYATDGQMDGWQFSKLCKDCKLPDRKFPAASIDTVFAKAKPAGRRKISVVEFERALQDIADRKQVDVNDVRARVALGSGPKPKGTKGVNPLHRFHDDKSLYTGTHRLGGPEMARKGDGSSHKDVVWATGAVAW